MQFLVLGAPEVGTTGTWKSHMELAFHACVALACSPRLLLLAAVRSKESWLDEPLVWLSTAPFS